MAKEGYLFIDHRASPGIPEAEAIQMGLDPALVKQGKVFEAATLRCGHCMSVFVKNPLRTRERSHCFQCNSYLCDGCGAAQKTTGYVHICGQEVIDKVTSGKFTLSGTSSLPVLTPTEIKNG